MKIKEYKEQYPGLYYFDTFTFTTLGTSGSRGPDASKSYANAPWREGDFFIQDGQQHWTVPANGVYQITAAGAYGATPGRVVTGQVELNKGQIVKLLVGQCPSQLTANVQDNVTVGGGGGTFVVSGDTPLIVAGGGDGTGGTSALFTLTSLTGDFFNYQYLNSTDQPAIVTTLNNYGNLLSAITVSLIFQINSALFEFINDEWVFKHTLTSQTCLYNDNSSVYSTDWFVFYPAFTVRINEYTYGSWDLVKYTDITSSFSVSSVQMSQNGTTLFLGGNLHILLYKRINDEWVQILEISGEEYSFWGGILSEDGNRFISYNTTSKELYVRDYPWSTQTVYTLFDNPYGFISPDGTLYATYSNLYSLTDGSVITSLPGYTLQNNSYISISKDNKTIIKDIKGIGLQIIKEPFNEVTYTINPLGDSSFYFPSKLNESGNIITDSGITYSRIIGSTAFPSFSNPYGDGKGYNGAGYFTDGEETNSSFKFLKPKAYINGGFGNQTFGTVVPETGGFGGGQSPVTNGLISGGGGYTGSKGDSIFGSVCYAAPSVVNFTDLGMSNTSGSVEISLIDPTPLVESWSWDDESPWENINTFQSNVYTIVWNESLGLFIAGSLDITPVIGISRDGINWTQPKLTGFDLLGYSTLYQLVSATDRPIIVMGNLTSTDAIHWNNNNLPVGLPRTTYVNGMFMVSTNQVEYDVPGLYTSTDGYTWLLMSPTFTGSVKAYNNSIYVGISSDLLSYGGTLCFSNDLYTWNLTNYSDIYDVTYGNGVFVAVGNGAYFSVDGTVWNEGEIPNEWISGFHNIIFGNGIFISLSFDIYNNQFRVYNSVDGIQWTYSTNISASGIDIASIAYSPSIGIFNCVTFNSSPKVTLEGKYFSPVGTYFKQPVLDFAWSNELKAFVIVAGTNLTTTPIYVYTSFDEGATWKEQLLLESFSVFDSVHIVWSSDFGLFFIYAPISQSDVKIFTSDDAITWNMHSTPINCYNFEFTKPFWCKQRGIFTNGRYLSRDGINLTTTTSAQSRNVKAFSNELGIFVSSYFNEYFPSGYSYDGSQWTNLPYVFTSIAWSSSLGLFIAVRQLNQEGSGSSFSLYGSVDGVNWNKVIDLISFPGTVGFNIYWVVWNNELQKFYLLYSDAVLLNNNLSLTESSDGYTWSTVIYPNTNTTIKTQDFAWMPGLDRFVIQSNEIFRGITFSPKFVKQF